MPTSRNDLLERIASLQKVQDCLGASCKSGIFTNAHVGFHNRSMEIKQLDSYSHAEAYLLAPSGYLYYAKLEHAKKGWEVIHVGREIYRPAMNIAYGEIPTIDTIRMDNGHSIEEVITDITHYDGLTNNRSLCIPERCTSVRKGMEVTERVFKLCQAYNTQPGEEVILPIMSDTRHGKVCYLTPKGTEFKIDGFSSLIYGSNPVKAEIGQARVRGCGYSQQNGEPLSWLGSEEFNRTEFEVLDRLVEVWNYQASALFAGCETKKDFEEWAASFQSRLDSNPPEQELTCDVELA